jgi:monoamine oxidase
VPRTPLASRLQRLAARADRADGLVAVNAAPANAAERDSAHTRRDFMRRAGVVGVGAAAAAALPASFARAANPPKVVVVGAGLAGLTVTWRLKQAGIVADLHEASDRYGGRCWTRYNGFAGNQITERGGELIDTGHAEIRRLIREFDLDLLNLLAAEAPGTEPFYYFDGQAYSDAQATADYRVVRPQLRQDVKDAGYPTTYLSSTARGRQLDNMSVAQYIDQVVPGGRSSKFGQLLDVAYNIEYGAETNQQSALNLLYLLGYSTKDFEIFGESDEKFKIDGGNDQLVDALKAKVNQQTTLNSELVRIARRSGGGYDLRFKQGGATKNVQADRVVLALPFSILRSSVDYSQASFRALKRTAIRDQGMGTNSKLAVQFTHRRWETLGCNGDTFADTGYQNTWETTRGQPGPEGILLNYTGGNVGLALTGNPDTLARRFCTQIEPVLPGITTRYNGNAKLDHWPSYPWTKGSYAYWKPGQYQGFAGVESEIENECHFAGEHTSLDFQGYMNGAVETGERAAAEVIAALA